MYSRCVQEQDPQSSTPGAAFPDASHQRPAQLDGTAPAAPKGQPAAATGPGTYPDWGAPAAYSAEPPAVTNRLAIASFVLALLGGSLLSAILAIAALRQIFWREEKGRGLAIAGLVISGCTTLACALYLLLPESAAVDPTKADPGVNRALYGSPLGPGNCIRSVEGADATNPTVVPCTGPHTAEVFTVFTFPDGPYPGEAELIAEIEKRCTRSFKPYLTAENESMELHYLGPTARSWMVSRTVTCIVADPAGMTGSLVG